MLSRLLPDWRLGLAAVIAGVAGLPPLTHRLTRKRRLLQGELEKTHALPEFLHRQQLLGEDGEGVERST